MSYFPFPVMWVVCDGTMFLWIQNIHGGGKCGTVVPWLQMKVVCVGKSEN